nr:putative capsid protein [Cressdnaviricota sp.]
MADKKLAFGLPNKGRPLRRGLPKRVPGKMVPYKPGNLGGSIDGIKGMAIKAVKDYAFDKLHEIATEVGSRELKAVIKGQKTRVKKVDPPTEGDKREHALVATRKGVKILTLGTEKLQVFRRRVDTGVPTSKSLLDVVKQNGKTSYTLYDSKNSDPLDERVLTRQMLTTGTGFEQRGYHAYGRPSYMVYSDIYEKVLNIPGGAYPTQTSDTRIYASILNTSTRYTVRNQSAFHRVRLKAHLCSYRSPDVANVSDPLTALANHVGWFDIDSTTSEAEKEKIPRYLQLQNQRFETLSAELNNSATWSVDMSPRGSGIKSSPYFRKNFEIHHTEGIILGPGDFFEFTHRHHYGSGVEVTALMSVAANALQNQLESHMNYFVIWEYVGFPCEITYNREIPGGTNAFEAYIGTSPVILNTEINKMITYANAERGPITVLEGERDIQFCHLRYFEKASLPRHKERRDFNLPLNKWSAAAQLPVGSYFIQIASDRTVRIDAHVAGNTNATDILPA